MTTTLKWLQNWYKSQCNGHWEHAYGILIQTADNPGWTIEIDLTDTELEDIVIEYELIEKSENDWYGLSIKEKVFRAAGDPDKLEFLLEKFQQLIIEKSFKV